MNIFEMSPSTTPDPRESLHEKTPSARAQEICDSLAELSPSLAAYPQQRRWLRDLLAQVTVDSQVVGCLTPPRFARHRLYRIHVLAGGKWYALEDYVRRESWHPIWGEHGERSAPFPVAESPLVWGRLLHLLVGYEVDKDKVVAQALIDHGRAIRRAAGYKLPGDVDASR
jgi:hypothetical protein